MAKTVYGWHPDLPDHRDFSLDGVFAGTLPIKVDLRPYCPVPYDQGQLGSCTANAIGHLMQVMETRQLDVQPTPSMVPSRLFIYYEERKLEGTLGYDSGANLRDGMKVIAKLGAPPEKMWPYRISKFKSKAPVAAYTEALKHQAIVYARIGQSVAQMKQCMASGYPFVYGFTVYESFESEAVAATGVVPMPGAGESALGGHAVIACGYDDALQCVITENSWGAKWGDRGFFYMPYKYIENPNLADDFWTLRKVEE